MSEDKKQKKEKTPRFNFLGVSIILSSLILGGSIIYASIYIAELIAGLPESVQEEQEEQEILMPEIGQSDHIFGDPLAAVTIVEFSDFQCPFCTRFHSILTQVINEYSPQVRWVYKHFPLDSFHPQARPAAEASECAAEQDKFWEFADKLFENQTILSSELYKELASDLDLDSEKFEKCVDERKYKDKVEADYQHGLELGIRGTPGSFINSTQLVGAVSYESLKSEVEQVLNNL